MTESASTLVRDLSLATRSGLPDDLRLLLVRYPREVWTAHPKLGQMASFWLSRHAMFREIGGMLGDASDRFRQGQIDAQQFAEFFAPRLQFLLQQLHAHHHIEDDHYFPIFRRAETRLVHGFEMLEGDHDQLADSIGNSVEAANGFLRALSGPPDALRPAVESCMQQSAVLLHGLTRHLDDEEDLIVPLILDRGELALGVGH
jgi:hemerythrin-like domain-containing protein